jgi:membrane protease YdiL (CAAX protease family)
MVISSPAPAPARATSTPARPPSASSRPTRIARAVAPAALLIGGLVVVRAAGGAAQSALGLPVLLSDVAIAVLLLATYRMLVRRVEGRRAAELSPEGAGRELAAGLAIGAGLFVTTAGILALCGTFHVGSGTTLAALWPALGSAILAGVFEELLIRGVLFRAIERRTGSVAALAISSAIFGLLHLVNPGATLLSALSIALETGALLGGAYLLTRRLWLAIGLHVAWNATESAIFGSPTSGVDIDGLLHSSLTGSTVLSGGSFGVEGSAVTIVTCLAVGALFLLWRRARPTVAPAGAPGPA